MHNQEGSGAQVYEVTRPSCGYFHQTPQVWRFSQIKEFAWSGEIKFKGGCWKLNLNKLIIIMLVVVLVGGYYYASGRHGKLSCVSGAIIVLVEDMGKLWSYNCASGSHG